MGSNAQHLKGMERSHDTFAKGLHPFVRWCGGRRLLPKELLRSGETRSDLITVSPFPAKLPGAERLFNLAEKGRSPPSIWKLNPEKNPIKNQVVLQGDGLFISGCLETKARGKLLDASSTVPAGEQHFSPAPGHVLTSWQRRGQSLAEHKVPVHVMEDEP